MSLIPIIDISSARRADLEVKRAVASQLDQVCRGSGFFGVVGHGMAQEQIDALHRSMADFFERPAAQKARYVLDRSVSANYTDACPYGYNALETENQAAFMGRKGPNDLVERLSTGPAILEEGRDLPLPDDEHMPGFRAQIEAFYRACKEMSAVVGELFALAVDLPIDYFSSKMHHAHDALRLNAYARLPEQVHDLGLAAHTDATLFTLVTQSRDGLLIPDEQGDWKLVQTPSSEVIVVNIGDLMMRWTNDEWISTEHKVRLADERRYSTTYFKVVDQDTQVEVLPKFAEGREVKYEPIAFTEYITEKLNRLFQVS